MECMFCKSTNLTDNIKITAGGAHVHPTGLVYTEKKVWTKTEPFKAQLCNDCGTVRFYVEETNRNWKLNK